MLIRIQCLPKNISIHTSVVVDEASVVVKTVVTGVVVVTTSGVVVVGASVVVSGAHQTHHQSLAMTDEVCKLPG